MTPHEERQLKNSGLRRNQHTAPRPIHTAPRPSLFQQRAGIEAALSQHESALNRANIGPPAMGSFIQSQKDSTPQVGARPSPTEAAVNPKSRVQSPSTPIKPVSDVIDPNAQRKSILEQVQARANPTEATQRVEAIGDQYAKDANQAIGLSTEARERAREAGQRGVDAAENLPVRTQEGILDSINYPSEGSDPRVLDSLVPSRVPSRPIPEVPDTAGQLKATPEANLPKGPDWEQQRANLTSAYDNLKPDDLEEYGWDSWLTGLAEGAFDADNLADAILGAGLGARKASEAAEKEQKAHDRELRQLEAQKLLAQNQQSLAQAQSERELAFQDYQIAQERERAIIGAEQQQWQQQMSRIGILDQRDAERQKLQMQGRLFDAQREDTEFARHKAAQAAEAGISLQALNIADASVLTRAQLVMKAELQAAGMDAQATQHLASLYGDVAAKNLQIGLGAEEAGNQATRLLLAAEPLLGSIEAGQQRAFMSELIGADVNVLIGLREAGFENPMGVIAAKVFFDKVAKGETTTVAGSDLLKHLRGLHAQGLTNLTDAATKALDGKIHPELLENIKKELLTGAIQEIDSEVDDRLNPDTLWDWDNPRVDSDGLLHLRGNQSTNPAIAPPPTEVPRPSVLEQIQAPKTPTTQISILDQQALNQYKFQAPEFFQSIDIDALINYAKENGKNIAQTLHDLWQHHRANFNKGSELPSVESNTP